VSVMTKSVFKRTYLFPGIPEHFFEPEHEFLMRAGAIYLM
jgi:hypothetical protein